METSNCSEDSSSQAAQSDSLLTRYTQALEMARYEGRSIWSIMGAFLLAQTVLLSVMGHGMISAEARLSPNLLLAIGAFVGLFLCLPWWSAISRNSAYYDLRTLQARELECKIGAKLLKQGNTFHQGGEVTVDGRPMRMPWLSQHLTTGLSGRLIIIVYTLIFGTILAAQLPCWY